MKQIALMAGATLVAFSSAWATDIRPPVELYAPIVWNPAFAVEESVYPEVDLRLHIDHRGRVTEVEIRSISPSTHLDEKFRDHVETSLAKWRYAPKIVDGQPVSTVLSWTHQFRDYRGESTSASSSEPEGILTYQGVGLDRNKIKQRRVRLLEEALSQAFETLDQSLTRSEQSDLFAVHTDAERDDMPEQLATNVSAIYSSLYEIFATEVKLSPPVLKLQVVAFDSTARFQAFRALTAASIEWADAFYSPRGLVAIQLQHRSGDDIVGSLLHEVTHAFVGAHLARPDRPFPRWLGEGLATYLENSSIKKGRLIPGRTLRREFKMVQGSLVKRTARSYFDLETAKKALRQGRGPTIEELLTTDFKTFYGERRKLYYPASWLLVHFLRHGEEEWAKQKFPRLVLYSAEGFSGVETLEAIYQRPLGELENAFQEYLRTF